MDKIEKLIDSNSFISVKDAEEIGLSKYKFYKYVLEKGLILINHGIYTKEDELVDELLLLSKRCPNGVFSHDEAFYYYGLSDREPIMHTLTIYSGYNSHRLKKDGNCKVYTVKKELLDLGKTIIKDNFGNNIPIYNLERTICDLVRSRNSIERDEFISILKAYARKKDKDINRLMEYAEVFKVNNIVRTYMEVLI